jgi:hypothetical protein
MVTSGSRDSSVGTATGMWAGRPRVRVRVPVGQEISLFHIVQMGSGDHSAFYPIGTGGPFLGGKVAGA